MNTVNILIVVDALGAATSGNLMNNVYLIDNEKYLGSWNEGQCTLYTLVQDGQVIQWSVATVDPSEEASISSFSGEMVDKKVCIPQKGGLEDLWKGRVESGPGRYKYTVNLSIEGRIMSFSPFIVVQ